MRKLRLETFWNSTKPYNESNCFLKKNCYNDGRNSISLIIFVSMLSDIALFDPLSESEKQSLSLFCQERLLSAGEVLFHEGDEATALYVVISGTLKVYQDRSSGVRVLGTVSVGEMVGEFALFDEANYAKTRTATVQAEEPTSLLVIMNYSIADLAKKHSAIYQKIREILQKRKMQNIG